jgi:MSHA biogenesis protein MshM
MYRDHFGLRELPFGITPDTGFFFACPTYQEALNTLLVAAKTGEGFIKITGEVGVGKTLLCRKFMATLDKSFVTA